jgi:hypothetical protein
MFRLRELVLRFLGYCPCGRPLGRDGLCRHCDVSTLLVAWSNTLRG